MQNQKKCIQQHLLVPLQNQGQIQLQTSFSSSSSQGSQGILLSLEDIQALCERDVKLNSESMKQIIKAFVFKFYNLQLTKVITDGNIRMGKSQEEQKQEQEPSSKHDAQKQQITIEKKQTKNQKHKMGRKRSSNASFKMEIEQNTVGQNNKLDKRLLKRISSKQNKTQGKRQGQTSSLSIQLPQIQKRVQQIEIQLKRINQLLQNSKVQVEKKSQNQSLQHINKKTKNQQVRNKFLCSNVLNKQMFEVQKVQEQNGIVVKFVNKQGQTTGNLILNQNQFMRQKQKGQRQLKYQIGYKIKVLNSKNKRIKFGFIKTMRQYQQKSQNMAQIILYDGQSGKIVHNKNQVTNLARNPLQIQDEFIIKLNIQGNRVNIQWNRGGDSLIYQTIQKEQNKNSMQTTWKPCIVFQDQNDSIFIQ